MARLHAHRPDRSIAVRRRDDVPAEFLWRGRLYRVREVLERWSACGAWWDLAAATAGRVAAAGSSPADDLEVAPIPSSPKWAQRAWGEPAPDVGAAVGPVSLLDDEREFWRVEAGSGAASGWGVYDLCLDVSSGQWSLAAVVD